MGVVWRAVDTTLDREAAIKFLPAAVGDDPERLARGPIPVDETVELACEMAAALAAAHEAGVWSFGCVLYECLTGRGAFEGATVSEILAEVLKSEPDWAALPPSTPPAVRRVLRRCLVKDPRERLCDLGDARLELSDAEPAARSCTDGPHRLRSGCGHTRHRGRPARFLLA